MSPKDLHNTSKETKKNANKRLVKTHAQHI